MNFTSASGAGRKQRFGPVVKTQHTAKLNGKPVKVTGVITYNFVGQ